VFDVDQLPRSSLTSLRTTLLTALQAYTQGPRVIQTQLCLTLSALALQLRDGEDAEWGDHVVAWMIDRFGKDAKDVGTLLEFLQVLPEEVTSNHRIPVDVSAQL
jgi:transportin-3